ncbi:hypothetical protein RRSWK_06834 [Rhodopirellula sp. SWK7]|nr:hypothetical protein RRSWK_06834 [Rhodopirellula sp. SWK7]
MEEVADTDGALDSRDIEANLLTDADSRAVGGRRTNCKKDVPTT